MLHIVGVAKNHYGATRLTIEWPVGECRVPNAEFRQVMFPLFQ